MVEGQPVLLTRESRAPTLTKADRTHKGFITVNDLTAHTLVGLRRWNVTHGGTLQEPTARVEGVGDMILVDRREAGKT
ncbi:MAG: hypothetical protein WHX52_10705 [Anaerolineae bacterium]